VYEWPGQEEPYINQPLNNPVVIDQISIFTNLTNGYTEGEINLPKQEIFTIRINDSYGR